MGGLLLVLVSVAALFGPAVVVLQITLDDYVIAILHFRMGILEVLDTRGDVQTQRLFHLWKGVDNPIVPSANDALGRNLEHTIVVPKLFEHQGVAWRLGSGSPQVGMSTRRTAVFCCQIAHIWACPYRHFSGDIHNNLQHCGASTRGIGNAERHEHGAWSHEHGVVVDIQ